MPPAVLKLTRDLFCHMAAHEAQAEHDARTAHQVGEEGRYGEAEILRFLARGHRIRILEIRSYIALLEAVFGLERD
jgi:hypothetical protein